MCKKEKGETTSCTSDDHCRNKTGEWLPGGHGLFTGKCETRVGTCEISGWCPIEDDSKDQLPL